MCDIYLRAREEGALVGKQQTPPKSRNLIRSLAKVGIVALVDEVTGYQDARAKDALAKILKPLSQKNYNLGLNLPLDYYKELCRLYGVQFLRKIIINFHNSSGILQTTPCMPDSLQSYYQNSKNRQVNKQKSKITPVFNGRRRGHPKLREHLSSIVTLLKLSKDKDNFYEMLDKIHPLRINAVKIDRTFSSNK